MPVDPTARLLAATAVAAIAIAIAVAGCAKPPAADAPEDFEAVVARMQSDPAFLASRTAEPLRVVDTLGAFGEQAGTRTTDCRLGALLAAGWRILPSAASLAETGVVYGAPEFAGDDAVSLDIGPAESESDARFVFARREGRWMLVGVERLGLDPRTPPPPCGPPAPATR